MEYAQIEEQEQLNALYDQMTGQSNGSISNDETSKLIEFKKQIASVITDMGVETSEDADASTMSNNIRSIENNVAPTLTQTVSSTKTMAATTTKKYTYTFSNIESIVGATNIVISGNRFVVRGLTISGNTIVISLYNGSSEEQTASCSITAIGY